MSRPRRTRASHGQRLDYRSLEPRKLLAAATFDVPLPRQVASPDQRSLVQDAPTELQPPIQSASFNADGNLVRTTDLLGRQRVFRYDNVDRLTNETWIENGQIVNELSYQYDESGNLVSAADDSSEYRFEYKSAELNISAEVDQRNSEFHLVDTFDDDGNLVGTLDSDGVRIDVERNGDQIQVTWSAPEFDPLQVQAGGKRAASGLNARLVNLDGKQSTPQLEELVLDMEQIFQASKQGVKVRSQLDPTNVTGTSAATQFIVGDFQYTFDEQGNLTGKADLVSGDYATFEYDHRDQLIAGHAFSQNGQSVAFVQISYDVFGRPVQQKLDADGSGPFPPQYGHTVYHGDLPWAHFDGDGNAIERYLFFDNQLLAYWNAADGRSVQIVNDFLEMTNSTHQAIQSSPFYHSLAGDKGLSDLRFTSEGLTANNDIFSRSRWFNPADPFSNDTISSPGNEAWHSFGSSSRLVSLAQREAVENDANVVVQLGRPRNTIPVSIEVQRSAEAKPIDADIELLLQQFDHFALAAQQDASESTGSVREAGPEKTASLTFPAASTTEVAARDTEALDSDSETGNPVNHAFGPVALAAGIAWIRKRRRQ